MTLNADYKEKIYDILDISLLSEGDKILLNQYIANIIETQETRIIEILTQYENIDFETDIINFEGVDINPDRVKKSLKKKLANALRFNPNFHKTFKVI